MSDPIEDLTALVPPRRSWLARYGARLAGALAIGLAAFVIWQATDASPPASNASADQAGADRAAELALITDPLRNGPEIDRRLAERITRRGDLLLIRDPLSKNIVYTYALPKNAAWVVRCNFLGLAVMFPMQDDGIELILSRAKLSEAECGQLAESAGRKMHGLAN